MNCLVVGVDGPLVGAVRAGLEAVGASVATAPVADSREQAERAVAAAREAIGEISALVTCPPDGVPTSFDELTPAVFDATLAASFRSPFLYTQAALPQLRIAPHGRLVYVVSTLGISGQPRTAHVAAAEQAVIALMRTATLEIEPPLTANAIAVPPGGQLADVESLVDSINWILRPQSSHLTGQVITVAGGPEPPA